MTPGPSCFLPPRTAGYLSTPMPLPTVVAAMRARVEARLNVDFPLTEPVA
jgi:hypothetical protein